MYVHVIGPLKFRLKPSTTCHLWPLPITLIAYLSGLIKGHILQYTSKDKKVMFQEFRSAIFD